MGKSIAVSDDLSIPNAGYRSNQPARYGTGQSRSRRGMDPDTRRLVLFASGLGTVLVALISASALIRPHGTDIPIIIADSHPIRVKPENPGGMKIDGAENDVFSGGSDTANAKLAPAAEKPDTKALHTVEGPHALRLVPSDAAPPPTAAAMPLPPVARPIVTNVSPAEKPAAMANAKPQPSAPDVQPSAPEHPPTVQLAALGSEAAARSEWQQLAKRMPDVLNGRQPNFSRTEQDGRTFWRLRMSGFTDVAQARSFCIRVRAKGAECSVADF